MEKERIFLKSEKDYNILFLYGPYKRELTEFINNY